MVPRNLSPAIFALLLIAFSLAITTTSSADEKQLNLLIIQTDEHNFRTLGCYRDRMPTEQALMWGAAVVETPNIDWIAKNGAMCTSFYATTPVCSPSRGSLVSGRYPQNTPVTNNNIPLDDNIVTFAEILRRSGYATGFAGKWHLDGSGKPQWAPKRKFGFEDNRFMFNRGHWKKLEITETGPRVASRNTQDGPTYGVDDADEKSFTTDFLADRTIDFINENSAKPFCYFLSLPDPHGPDTVRAPYDTMFAEQEYEKPRTFDKDAEMAPAWGKPAGGGGYGQAKYYGMVRCIDDNVGRIIKTLREKKILDHTIVVFTSDHGDLRGEHHRQNKGVPYESSARVPFLIHCPGKIKAGTVIDEALSCVDFQPTILNLMATELSGKEEGRDFTSLFAAEKSASDWNDIAFIRGTGTESGWIAAVTDRFKLVYSSSDNPWLLDLERDPDELTNFFEHDGYREVVQQLATRLKQYGTDHNDPRISAPRIAADIEWSVNGTGKYQALPAAKSNREKANEKKRNKRNSTQAD